MDLLISAFRTLKVFLRTLSVLLYPSHLVLSIALSHLTLEIFNYKLLL